MKSIIVSMDELSDSREMMEKKEPSSIRWFIIIISFAVVVAFIIANFFEIDEYVKASGEIKTVNISSTVTVSSESRVKETLVSEGDSIKKGDVLFTLDVDFAKQKQDLIEKRLQNIQTNSDNLILLRNSIAEGKNLFVGEKYNEEFFYRYEQYQSGVALHTQEFETSQQKNTLSKKDIENKLDRASKDLEEKRQLLSEYKALKECVEQDYSYDGNNASVAASYEEYSLNIQKAMVAYENAEKAYYDLENKYQEQNDSGYITASDVAALKNEAEAVATTISSQTSEFLFYIDLQISSLSSQLQTGENPVINDSYNEELGELFNEYVALKTAIIEGQPYMCVFEEVRTIYDDYIDSMSTLQSEYDTRLAAYEDLLFEYENQKTATIDQSTLDNAFYTYENAGLEVSRIKNAYISQIENNIVSLETEVNSLTSSVKSLEIALAEKDTNIEKQKLSEEKEKNDTIVSINNEIEAVKADKLSLEAQLSELENTIKNGTITASCDGTVTLLHNVNSGDIVSAGTQLCTIVPINNALKAILLIPENEISKIAVGQRVEYIIAAIPYNEYGRITGTVVSITADSTIIQGQNRKYYLAEADIPVNTLENKAGEERSIQTGMLLEGKIICGSKRVIIWLLQKINLMD